MYIESLPATFQSQQEHCKAIVLYIASIQIHTSILFDIFYKSTLRKTATENVLLRIRT